MEALAGNNSPKQSTIPAAPNESHPQTTNMSNDKIVDYEGLLERIGEFGRHQKLLFLCCCVMAIPAAFNNMTIVFLAAVPDHSCDNPGIAHLQLDKETLLNLTTPTESKDGEMVYSKCQTYDRDYTNWTQENVTEFLTSGENYRSASVRNCEKGWMYDMSTYTSTIVTEWNLVCEKRALVPTASSVYMAGLMVGVVIFGFVSDKFGRRIALSICIVMTVIFSIAIAFANNYVAFVAFRFILAMANIGLFTTAFVIGIEMVGPKWRVFAGIVIEYFWALGYMLIAAIAYGLRDWRKLALAVSVPQALLLIFIFVMPESPRWLYSQNKHERADVIVRKMAKINRKELPEKIDIVVKEGPTAYVWDLFKYPKLRLRTLNIFFNWFVNSLVYYGLSLNTSNLGGSDYINFFISGAVEIPAYLFCQISLQYIGRRYNLAATMVTGGISLLLILAVPKEYNVIAIVLAMIGKFCISASFAIIYVFSAEIFPTVVRNVGVGSGSFFARVGGIVAPYIGALAEQSRFIPYITFGALSIAAGLLGVLLPETKDRQLPETIEDGENFPGIPKEKKVSPEVGRPDNSTPTHGHTNPAYETGF